MSRNLPHVRVSDTITYPTQTVISWQLNKEKCIAIDANYGNNALSSTDVMNRVSYQMHTNVEFLYDLVAVRGDTASRPTLDQHQYFDTDLSIPIWWDGTQWINAVGTVV
jgi:hypothetical protein